MSPSMTRLGDATRLLVLGSSEGWHAEQLRDAAVRAGCHITFAPYESLRSSITTGQNAGSACEAGPLAAFDAIIARTMPTGSFEQITFRLAVLHEHVRLGGHVINPPRSLELAIDKFATLAIIASLGYRVPETRVVQSRGEAMEAFRALGGDCVVKPIFGGEGRGVMRIRDPELAWYAFATLERVDAMFYVQAFVAPGGRDTRLLVIGDEIHALRRTNPNDFRTNVAGGANCHVTTLSDADRALALHITRVMGLQFASVDLLDTEDGPQRIVEVNGIPGWRGAQQVLASNVGDSIIRVALQATATRQERVSA